MKDIKNNNNLAIAKYKRGFTLVETIVAIFVILLISFSTFSLIIYVNSLSQKSDAKSFFINQMDSFVSCYIADGFKMGDDSSVRFFVGSDCYIEDLIDNTENLCSYIIGYNKDFSFCTEEKYPNAFYKLKIKLSQEGIKIIVVTAKDEKVCAMADFFKSAEVYANYTPSDEPILGG